MKMDEQISAMRAKIEAAAAAISDSREMHQLRKQYLDAKAGHISAMMKQMRLYALAFSPATPRPTPTTPHSTTPTDSFLPPTT